jgi:hypothetical protein
MDFKMEAAVELLIKEEYKDENLRDKRLKNEIASKAARCGFRWSEDEGAMVDGKKDELEMDGLLVCDNKIADKIFKIADLLQREPSAIAYRILDGSKSSTRRFVKSLNEIYARTQKGIKKKKIEEIKEAKKAKKDVRNLYQKPILERIVSALQSGESYYGRLGLDAGTGKSVSARKLAHWFLEEYKGVINKPNIFIKLYPTNDLVGEGYEAGVEHLSGIGDKDAIIMKLIGSEWYQKEDINELIEIVEYIQNETRSVKHDVAFSEELKSVHKQLEMYRSKKGVKEEGEFSTSPEKKVFRLLKKIKLLNSGDYHKVEEYVLEHKPSVFMHGNKKIIERVFSGKKIIVYTNVWSYLCPRGDGEILAKKIGEDAVGMWADEIHKITDAFARIHENDNKITDSMAQEMMKVVRVHFDCYNKEKKLKDEVLDKIQDLTTRTNFYKIVPKEKYGEFVEHCKATISKFLETGLGNEVIKHQINCGELLSPDYIAKDSASVNLLFKYDHANPDKTRRNTTNKSINEKVFVQGENKVLELVPYNKNREGAVITQEERRHYLEIIMSFPGYIKQELGRWVNKNGKIDLTDWLEAERSEEEVGQMAEELVCAVLGQSGNEVSFQDNSTGINSVVMSFSELVEGYNSRFSYNGTKVANLVKKTDLKKIFPRLMISTSASIFKDGLGNMPLFENEDIKVIDMLSEEKTIRDGWLKYNSILKEKELENWKKSFIYSDKKWDDVIERGIGHLKCGKEKSDRVGLVVVNSKDQVSQVKSYIEENHPNNEVITWLDNLKKDVAVSSDVKNWINKGHKGIKDLFCVVVIYKQIVEGKNIKYTLSGKGERDISTEILPWKMTHLKMDVIDIAKHIDANNLDSSLKRILDKAHVNDKDLKNRQIGNLEKKISTYRSEVLGLSDKSVKSINARGEVGQVIGRVQRGVFGKSKFIFCTPEWVEQIRFHYNESRKENIISPTLSILEAMFDNYDRGVSPHKWDDWFSGSIKSLEALKNNQWGLYNEIGFRELKNNGVDKFKPILKDFFAKIRKHNPNVDIGKAIDEFDYRLLEMDAIDEQQLVTKGWIDLYRLIRDVVVNGNMRISELDADSSLEDIFKCMSVMFDADDIQKHKKGDAGELAFLDYYNKKHAVRSGELMSNEVLALRLNNTDSWEAGDWYLWDSTKKRLDIIDVKHWMSAENGISNERWKEMCEDVMAKKMQKIQNIVESDCFQGCKVRFIWAMKDMSYSSKADVEIDNNVCVYLKAF